MVDLNKVVQALRNTNDPRTGLNIVDAKMVTDLKNKGNQIYFELNVTGLDQDLKQKVFFSAQEQIKKSIPEAEVHIHMAAKGGGKATNNPLHHIKNIIAVASGKGGVGKSTVSTNLALGLARLGAKVGLMDADLYGPSIPTMLGIKDERPKMREVYGKHKLIPIETHGLHTISIGNIIEPEKAVVLRGPRLGGIIKQFVNDCLWPELDYLIVDLPPGTGDIQLTLVQTVPLTGAVMVTTPQEVAVIDAVKAMNMFLLDNINVPILGVVENMSWFETEDVPGKKYEIFGAGGGKKLAKMSQSMLLGQIPLVEEIRKSSDKGTPAILDENTEYAKRFEQLAGQLAQQVYIRNETQQPTKIVQIKL